MIHYRSFFKPISLILILSILIQGCTVYYKQTVTQEKAFESSGGVKIIFVDNRKIYFDRIEIEDDILYGIKKIKGESIKILIHKDQIKEIHLKDKNASGVCTVLLVVGTIGLAFFIDYSVRGWDWY
jgi:hypothetical protein